MTRESRTVNSSREINRRFTKVVRQKTEGKNGFILTKKVESLAVQIYKYVGIQVIGETILQI